MRGLQAYLLVHSALGLVAILVVSAFVRSHPDPQRPRPHPTFGVLATSGSTLISGGESWGYPTAEDAATMAVAACHVYTHQDDCRPTLSFSNECAAIAASKIEKVVTTARNQEKSKAEVAALTLCARHAGSSCAILVSACSEPAV